jgi:TusA-related sulfurtransferase
MKSPLPIVRLDMTGHSCPLPLLGAKRVLDDLPDGHVMVLISDCPGTGDDLRAWADLTGHEVLRSEALNGRRVAYTIRRTSEAAANRGGVVLDLRGPQWPQPIVEARRRLRDMRPGEVLVLLSDSPSAPADVEAWAADGSVRLLDRYEPAPSQFEFYLSAARALPS